MSLDRAVMMFAGFMVLVSLALRHWVHPAWIWLTVFVGLNLFSGLNHRLLPGGHVVPAVRREAGDRVPVTLTPRLAARGQRQT